MKLHLADELRRNNNNCVIIIASMFKRSRKSVLQSYFNYEFLTFQKRKHKSSTCIKPTFGQSEARTRLEKLGPT